MKSRVIDAADKPLAGKRIVVTRAPEQSSQLSAALEQMGAHVISLPLVAFAPPQDSRSFDEALRNLDRFDAILFLSRNAVRYVAQRCEQLGLQCEAIGAPNRLVAAVGPATAQEATQRGMRVDFVAENRTGESLAREMRERLSDRNVLLPRSDRGDARMPALLREAGANVTEVTAYRTIAPEKVDAATLQRIRNGEVDAIVFASPSAFQNFADVIGDALKPVSGRVYFAAIGPTTAGAIRESGARVEIEVSNAAAIGISAIAGALAQYFKHHAAALPARSA